MTNTEIHLENFNFRINQKIISVTKEPQTIAVVLTNNIKQVFLE